MNTIVLDNVRNKILNLVECIKPYDFLEQQHIHNTISWIQSGDQIFRISKPDNPPKHLVVYFTMFDEAKQNVLLVDHKKAELWVPSGGHVDINEHPTDTVIRECMEELFVKAEFWCKKPIFVTETMTVGKTAGHTDVSLWYVIKGNSNIEYKYDPQEFFNIKWFHLDKIPYERCDPHMERFVEKLRNMKPYIS